MRKNSDLYADFKNALQSEYVKHPFDEVKTHTFVIEKDKLYKLSLKSCLINENTFLLKDIDYKCIINIRKDVNMTNNFAIVKDFYQSEEGSILYNINENALFDLYLHNKYPDSALNISGKYGMNFSEILEKFFKKIPKIK